MATALVHPSSAVPIISHHPSPTSLNLAGPSSSSFMATSPIPRAKPSSSYASDRPIDRTAPGYRAAMDTNAPGVPFTRLTSSASSSKSPFASHSPIEPAPDMTSSALRVTDAQSSSLHIYNPSNDPPEYEDVINSFSDSGHYASRRPPPTSPLQSRRTRPSRPLPAIPVPATRHSSYEVAAENIVGKPPAAMSPPPPAPLKSDLPIVAPSDFSHETSHLHDTASEPGHSSGNPILTSPGRTPLPKTYGAPSSSGYSPYTSRLTWADRALVPLYRNSYPALSVDSPPSMPLPEASRSGKSRLRKAHHPTVSPSPASSSRPASRIWRALSMRKHKSAVDISVSRSSSSDLGFQFVQSSDVGHDYPSSTSRPPARTYNSGSDSSTSHATNSTSNCTSPPLTPLTTPDSTSPPSSPVIVDAASPGLYANETSSPPILSAQFEHGIHVTRKLKKRRPSAPPSSLSHSVLGFTNLCPRRRATHTPQRSTTSFEGFLPPVSPQAPFHMSIPKDLQVQPASPGRSPVAQSKPKSSSHALAELALTGLCSSDFAAFASRLSIQSHSPERAAVLSDGDVEIQPPAFDPYSDYASSNNAHIRAGPTSNPSPSAAHGPSTRARRRVVSPTVVSASRSASASNMYPEHTALTSDAARLDRSPTATMRRWTLAMSDVSDDMLVQELDKLRKDTGRVVGTRPVKTGHRSQSGHWHEALSKSMRDQTHSIVYGASVQGEPQWSKGGRGRDTRGVPEGDDPEAEEEWKTARRALLACRELVRTERNYQARLQELLAAQSKHPMFSLVLSYVPALIEASEALLVRLVDDPSAWGVSAAFIGCEEELEAAFVSWCGIVGDFFSDAEKDKRGRKPSRRSHEDSASSAGHGEGNARSVSRAIPTFGSRGKSQSGQNIADGTSNPVEYRRRTIFTEGPNHPRSSGMFTAALGTGLAFGLSPVSHLGMPPKFQSSADVRRDTNHSTGGAISRTLSTWKRKSMPSSLSNLPAAVPPSSTFPPTGSQTGNGNTNTNQEKQLTVRDLAIQPSQRVMRYVLQYRDLLDHTPATSPSRGLVERALESALRIARKCDRAQGNSAFLRRP
ncbi:hypothetical protein B0H21DRAFT_774059 [Amylocystis lapponica]|nr:hypothetical protein B0H21DRAFT_774059 [Amylocystis lapponica]